MIEVQDLHKSFGPKNVLSGVSLSINPGETFCIIGRSGSGKSVLIKHIVGLLVPDKGKVFVDNRDVTKMSYKELIKIRMKMGFVFQGSALFDSYNVFENIVLGLYEHGERDTEKLEGVAQEVLSWVGLLPDFSQKGTSHFTREWDILKSKKPSDLSGGMKKRVGVARALVGNPEYILYDEPTTGLDPVTSEQVDNLIAELAEKLSVTSIVITHDMFSVYRVADRVLMLNKGKAQFSGTPEEMKNSRDEFVFEFLKRYHVQN